MNLILAQIKFLFSFELKNTGKIVSVANESVVLKKTEFW